MGYARWDDYYAIAQKLYESIGTINVPVSYEHNGYPIGDWLSRQRGIQRKSGLKPGRKSKLEQLGIIWDGNELKAECANEKFKKMYSLLKKYKEQFGHTRVPQAYTVDNIKLGSWVSSVRESLRDKGKRKITAEQKSMLEEIDFEVNWYAEQIDISWQTHFDLVAEYAEKYGIDSIIQGTSYKGKNIGNWVHSQRVSYKDGTLLPERHSKLIAIGLDFAPALSRWEKAFQLAEKYYTEFHNLNVPNDFVMDDFNLGSWVSNQRQVCNGSRTDMELTPEQIKRLESIGMVWQTTGASNTSFLEQAFFYYIKRSYADTITRDTSLGIELDIFVPSIKFAIEYDGSYWHKNKLSKDNEKDNLCQAAGIKLVRIREMPLPPTKSAICYSTTNKHNNQTLSSLIKIVLFEQLGIVIDVNTSRDAFDIIKDFTHLTGNAWFKYFLVAEQYYNKHSHLIVPVSYITPTGIKLGAWIQNQRCAYKGTTYGHLSPKEVEMLEAIGMVWDVRQYNWEKNYRVAEMYFEKNGHLLVGRDCVFEGVNLGRWINTQRNAYNCIGRRKISQERISRLEAIGMVWNTRKKSN